MIEFFLTTFRLLRGMASAWKGTLSSAPWSYHLLHHRRRVERGGRLLLQPHDAHHRGLRRSRTRDDAMGKLFTVVYPS
jgi:hypothetical protein